MARREHLTVDTMVFRDYLEKRSGHAEAFTLLELARKGQVELAAASSGYLIDATSPDPSTGDRISGKLWHDLRALFKKEGISDTAQLAYPGVMVPGPNLFPGAAVEGLAEAWTELLDNWRSHEGAKPHDADRLHVETHVMERRDVFITNEPGLVAMCRRLRLEYGFEVEAMTVGDYLASGSER